MTSDRTTFRRYTNLAAAIHLLRTRQIALLDPDKWDDRNDAAFMRLYKEEKNLASFLAICLASGAETYHHWKVFSPNSDGVCIEIEREPFLQMFEQHRPAVDHRRVEYVNLDSLSTRIPNLADLPFMKRAPYESENEYRVVFEDPNNKVSFKNFDIQLDWVKAVILSPWMASSLADSVRDTLRDIPGCENLRMFPSTLISNSAWQEWGKKVQTP